MGKTGRSEATIGPERSLSFLFRLVLSATWMGRFPLLPLYSFPDSNTVKESF